MSDMIWYFFFYFLGISESQRSLNVIRVMFAIEIVKYPRGHWNTYLSVKHIYVWSMLKKVSAIANVNKVLLQWLCLKRMSKDCVIFYNQFTTTTIIIMPK